MLGPGKARRVVRVLAWILFAFAAIGATTYYDVAYLSLSVGFAALAPYLLLAAVPAAVLFAIGRHRIGLALSVLALLFLVVTTAPLYVADDVPAGARDLRVLTINARLGQADAASVVAAVRRERPDFLMVEELTPALQQGLTSGGLERLLPYRRSSPAGAGAGTGLWSRYRLGRPLSLGLTLNSVVARADVPGFAVPPTVVALHLAGPFPVANDWVKDIYALPRKLDGLPRDAPVIVAGDFNATHSIAPFRGLLDDGYGDAGDQAGAGLLRTYPASGPVIGIDHVLVRGGVGREVHTVDIVGTDHLGLAATVAVPRTS